MEEEVKSDVGFHHLYGCLHQIELSVVLEVLLVAVDDSSIIVQGLHVDNVVTSRCQATVGIHVNGHIQGHAAPLFRIRRNVCASPAKTNPERSLASDYHPVSSVRRRRMSRILPSADCEHTIFTYFHHIIKTETHLAQHGSPMWGGVRELEWVMKAALPRETLSPWQCPFRILMGNAPNRVEVLMGPGQQSLGPGAHAIWQASIGRTGNVP